MKFTNGAQYVETIPGKRALKSGAVGATTVDEVRWLTNKLVTSSVAWKTSGWAYIVDISQMAPVTPEISAELINLHTKLTDAGCKAMAFVEGHAFMLAAQAKQHQQKSHAAIQEGHFRTEADALKWIDTIIK